MVKNKSGFTIIELLIVIVVIAILAAISVIAYTGIQNRAYNTKVIAGTQQYYNAFLNYKAINGTYPATNGCLGANYPNDACWAHSADGTISRYQRERPALDAELTEFVPSKPEISSEIMYLSEVAGYRGGLVYLPGDPSLNYRMTYYLKGNNANCTLDVVAYSNEGSLTQCNISLPD